MPELAKAFSIADKQMIADGMVHDSKYTFSLGGGKCKLDVTIDDVEFGFEAKEGWCYSKRDDVAVFLPSKRSEEMMARGLVKDLARRIQSLREGIAPRMF